MCLDVGADPAIHIDFGWELSVSNAASQCLRSPARALADFRSRDPVRFHKHNVPCRAPRETDRNLASHRDSTIFSCEVWCLVLSKICAGHAHLIEQFGLWNLDKSDFSGANVNGAALAVEA